MHLTVLIGGPEPKKKGQLNMIGYVVFSSRNIHAINL